MRHRAFTLLETVIALAIAMVVMGATVTANRVVQRNAQISSHQAQEEALINDAFGLITLTQNANKAKGQTLGSAFMGLGSNSPIRALPYRVRLEDPIQNTSPIYMQWCTPSTAGCQGIISTATPNASDNAFPVFANYTSTDALSLSGAEVIAIRKGTPVSGQPQMYDFTYLPASGNVISSTLDAANPTHYKEWDFYRRQISVTNRSTLYSGYVVTVTVWPMIGGKDRTAEQVSRTQIFTELP